MTQDRQQHEFNQIWGSLEPELKSDLERLDHRLRQISTEAITLGVKKPVVEMMLQRRFWELCGEIVKEKVSA